MTDLMQIISNGAANIKLEITGEDLRVFSDELINRAINEVTLAFRAATKPGRNKGYVRSVRCDLMALEQTELSEGRQSRQ